MFVKTLDYRFRIMMWSDSRLANKQGELCLCTKCAKEDEINNIECPTHKQFMRDTRILVVNAPIIACPKFEDRDEEAAFNRDWAVIEASKRGID